MIQNILTPFMQGAILVTQGYSTLIVVSASNEASTWMAFRRSDGDARHGLCENTLLREFLDGATLSGARVIDNPRLEHVVDAKNESVSPTNEVESY